MSHTAPETSDPRSSGSPVEEIDPDLVREPMRQLYDDLDRAISSIGPICELSGRCCRFQAYGHTLFVSAVEAALLIADAPPASRPLDDGATCPWQDDQGHCTARQARPLGCRVYFCDPAYEGHSGPISETFLGRLKRLVEAHHLPWAYAPLHHHLRTIDAGLWPDRPGAAALNADEIEDVNRARAAGSPPTSGLAPTTGGRGRASPSR